MRQIIPLFRATPVLRCCSGATPAVLGSALGHCRALYRDARAGKLKASSCLLGISWSIRLQVLTVRLRAAGRARGQAPSADAPLTCATREMDPLIFQRFQLILAYAHLVDFPRWQDCPWSPDHAWPYWRCHFSTSSCLKNLLLAPILRVQWYRQVNKSSVLWWTWEKKQLSLLTPGLLMYFT